MRKSRKADFEKLAVWGLGAFVLYRMYRENTPLVGQTNDTGNFKNITKETDYVQIRNIVLNEMGKDIFNAANLIAIDARYANQSWQADGNGKNGGISCDGFVALAMHEANLDGPKNDSNTIPDTTYVSTSGYSKSGLYYKVTDSKIGDVVVIRVGLNGSNKATHSHAAILGNIE